jgi:hypothetical protein
MTVLRVDIASEFTGKKAFDKADKATSSLDKTIGKLGKGLAATFAAEKILQFGVTAVKAFMEDEAAASKLAKTVDNLGLGFANPAIAKYVDSLTLASGVADNVLRPALQSLISTTGAVTYSQDLLTKAIDISKGSGIALETVVSDLTAAYTGQTKGLAKYKTGLSKAELAGLTFEQVMTKLNDQFAGSNSAYLQTYAGKVGLIKNAASEATEVIGKGLVDAFSILADGAGGDISSLTNGMINLATSIGDVFRGAAYYIKEFLNNPIVSKLIQVAMWFWNNIGKKLAKVANPVLGAIMSSAEKGKSLRPKDNVTGLTAAQQAALLEKDRLAKLKADRLATAAAKAKAATEKALKKAGTIFDLEQIQIIAALKGKISDEDRRRLELQFALLTGNEDEAKRLTYELAKAQGLGEHLANYLATLPDAKNPFASWSAYLDMLLEKARTLAMGDYATQPVVGNGSVARGSVFAAQNPVVQSLIIGSAGASAGVTSTGDVYVTVQGSVVSSEDLVAAIENGLQVRSLSGSNSVVGRIAGMFG